MFQETSDHVLNKSQDNMNFMKKEVKAKMQAEMQSMLAVASKQLMTKLLKTRKRLQFKVKPEHIFTFPSSLNSMAMNETL